MDNKSMMNYVLETFGDKIVEFTGSEVIIRFPASSDFQFQGGLSKAETLAGMIVTPKVASVPKSACKTHAFVAGSSRESVMPDEELGELRYNLERARKILDSYAKYCDNPCGYPPNHDKGAAYRAAEHLIETVLSGSEETLKFMEDNVSGFVSRTQSSAGED